MAIKMSSNEDSSDDVQAALMTLEGTLQRLHSESSQMLISEGGGTVDAMLKKMEELAEVRNNVELQLGDIFERFHSREGKMDELRDLTEQSEREKEELEEQRRIAEQAAKVKQVEMEELQRRSEAEKAELAKNHAREHGAAQARAKALEDALRDEAMKRAKLEMSLVQQRAGRSNAEGYLAKLREDLKSSQAKLAETESSIQRKREEDEAALARVHAQRESLEMELRQEADERARLEHDLMANRRRKSPEDQVAKEENSSPN